MAAFYFTLMHDPGSFYAQGSMSSTLGSRAPAAAHPFYNSFTCMYVCILFGDSNWCATAQRAKSGP